MAEAERRTEAGELSFDPASLSRGDWAMVEQIESMDGPAGPWPEGTRMLIKLVVWRWFGVFLSR